MLSLSSSKLSSQKAIISSKAVLSSLLIFKESQTFASRSKTLIVSQRSSLPVIRSANNTFIFCKAASTSSLNIKYLGASAVVDRTEMSAASLTPSPLNADIPTTLQSKAFAK